MKKNEKYLQQFPQVKPFVVRLKRDPYIEKVAKSMNITGRKSSRLKQLALSRLLVEADSTSTKRIPLNKAIERKSSVMFSPNRRIPTKSFHSPNANIYSEHVPTKSALKRAHTLRRSKSVTFDLPIVSPISSDSNDIAYDLIHRS